MSTSIYSNINLYYECQTCQAAINVEQNGLAVMNYLLNKHSQLYILVANVTHNNAELS